MKYVKMEYPDGSVHNTLIREYSHSQDKDVDYIDYYDMTDNKELYAVLKKVDGVIYKDSDILDYTYDELSSNKITKNMDELPDYIENKKEKTKDNSKYELEFEVYNTDSGLFIASTIAEAFHLNKKFRTKKINNIVCVPVSEDEVKRIEVISSQGIPSLKRKVVNELRFAYQSQAEFLVYHLIETNKYFVESKLCEQFGVGKGTHFINGVLCKEVTFDDIKTIEEKSKDYNPCLKAKFVELTFNNEKKETIEVYKNNDTNKYYIKEDICKNNNIGTGYHYIDNILYKEVTSNDLRVLENKKVDFKYKNLQFQPTVKQYIVYVDEYSNRYFVEDAIGKQLGIGKGIHYIGNKLCKEVTLKEIKELADTTKFSGIKYEPKYLLLTFFKNKEKVEKKNPINIIKTDVYKDKNNHNKLFVKKEDCEKYKIGDYSSFRYINNCECYEISLIELTKIKNPVIKTVYLQPEVIFKTVKNNKKSFIVCKYDKFNFINEEVAKTFNINYKTVINVDGQNFVYVNEKDIAKIENNSEFEKSIVDIKPADNNKDELDDMVEDKKLNNKTYKNKIRK